MPPMQQIEFDFTEPTDVELKKTLAEKLGVVNVGTYYDVWDGAKYVLDRKRIQPFLDDPKEAEAEIARRLEEERKEREASTKRPGFHQD